MRAWPCIWLCLCLCLFGRPVDARDLAAYRIGETATEDIITPVALDVVDAVATSELQSARARQFPAIFRSFPEATNIMAHSFLTAFAEARTNFLAEMTNEFHAQMLNEATIASDDFGRLVTVFGVQHRDFPIPDELAGQWARGDDGVPVRNRLLATLQLEANRHVCPDALPDGIFVGETIRLVPVTAVDEKLSFETVQQGNLAPATSLTTISNAQSLFRHEFPPEQQLFARALANLIQPNCFPDAPFTQLTRGTAVYQMIVSDHFDAGDAIVHRGDTIDAKTQAALTTLNEKLLASQHALPVAPAATNAPTTTVTTAAPSKQPQPQPPQIVTPVPAPAVAARSPISNPPAPAAKAGGRHIGLILGLAGMSVAWFVVAGWQFSKQRIRRSAPATPAQAPLPFPEIAKPDVGPQVAQAVREAVQQELAMQRRELLRSQEAATDEIATLVRRLDELQVPMQERLHTYETRIQVLEKELALRNQENQELLKLKIEMITRQLETERAASSMTPMAA